jgi:hypothetical protein
MGLAGAGHGQIMGVSKRLSAAYWKWQSGRYIVRDKKESVI